MGFHLGLAQRELDVAGENLTIEYRLGKDDPDRMPQLAMRSSEAAWGVALGNPPQSLNFETLR
jgi:hypothetical protein